jgi:hypothetical protein
VEFHVTNAEIGTTQEATYRSVSIYRTVNFTTPQALAVAEGVGCDLNRGEAKGNGSKNLGPIDITINSRVDA